jgi:2,3-bisphosphoglycerate-independent phosphoglycerate mutase
MPAPLLICILDGLGLNPNPRGNAVAVAKKPVLDKLFATQPMTTLVTHGERVGLPEGQMGNSEVGHLNIGAGRVVEQWLLRISRALSRGAIRDSAAYATLHQEVSGQGALHIVGLFSDGGVHSHSEHLYLLLDRISADFKSTIYLHLITDGRDTSPHRALDQVKDLESRIAQKYPHIKIATVCGRFYAMDRDKRWERVERAYKAIRLKDAPRAVSASQWIAASYEAKTTDEFIEPAVIDPTPVGEKDGIIFWNFREDRMREIVRVLCIENFADFPRPAPIFSAARVLCFTEYDHSFGLPFLFEPIEIKNHLGEVLSAQGLRQLRTAETEKYPHVTYFFNGGIEKAYSGEERVLIPSPRDVKTYDLKPEMSAEGVTEVVVNALTSKSADVIVVNLANCDMVGHTGVFEAAVRAVETADTCLGKMLTALDKVSGKAVILADHGNAEQLINYEDGSPFTSHTLFPVPFIVYGAGKLSLREGGALCDVAPTVLKLLVIPQPQEMTGKSLF